MGKGLEFKRESEVASCPNLEIQTKVQKTQNQMTIARIFSPRPNALQSSSLEDVDSLHHHMFSHTGLYIPYVLSCQKPNPVFLTEL
jgi:hypothetical protein